MTIINNKKDVNTIQYIMLFALLPMLLFFLKVTQIYFQSTEYRNITKISILKLIQDKGVYGEYLTYNILRKMNGEILTNLYIPKNNTTTEIDLVFINKTGMYVIESKNYSGKIYGSKENKYWMQILDNNKRNRFYSPIIQNKTHIKYLNKVLPDLSKEDFYSIIVFSERCKLRNMDIQEENLKVIKRDKLKYTMNKILKSKNEIYTDSEVESIYNKLENYSNVDEVVKENHIKNINSNY